ncbi:hypothetical protein PISMIDRAFT_673509 [Pisolithus microcarpus 441]|uniref:Uncharacterized protein n=1 Tax=Pisolithus microcarpus 441 TaxID=765257 RepID=A0A0D0A9B7_9AGAM|nr:hypothetical protein PISMIDRAFT_673509 [Pisolithus microcarpus 441]
MVWAYVKVQSDMSETNKTSSRAYRGVGPTVVLWDKRKPFKRPVGPAFGRRDRATGRGTL